MKNKFAKFIDVLRILGSIGIIVGCIFPKTDIALISGAFLLLLTPFVPNFRNRPHKKQLNILLNDERFVKIETESDAKTLRFLQKILSFFIGLSFLVLLIIKNKFPSCIPFIFCIDFTMVFCILVCFIAHIYFVGKISKQN